MTYTLYGKILLPLFIFFFFFLRLSSPLNTACSTYVSRKWSFSPKSRRSVRPSIQHRAADGLNNRANLSIGSNGAHVPYFAFIENYTVDVAIESIAFTRAGLPMAQPCTSISPNYQRSSCLLVLIIRNISLAIFSRAETTRCRRQRKGHRRRYKRRPSD